MYRTSYTSINYTYYLSIIVILFLLATDSTKMNYVILVDYCFKEKPYLVGNLHNKLLWQIFVYNDLSQDFEAWLLK